MIKDMQSDNAKHVEAGIGVFGNSLRSQLDTMANNNVSQRMEAETNLATKLDGLLGRVQQQSQRQVEAMNVTMEQNIGQSLEKCMKSPMSIISEFKNFMEEVTKVQDGRHQDLSSMVTSVLEQACGAKARAEECASRISAMSDQNRLQQDFRGEENDRASNAPEGRYTTGTSGTMPRPGTADGARSRFRSNESRSRDEVSKGFSPSKYSQYGMQVMNS